MALSNPLLPNDDAPAVVNPLKVTRPKPLAKAPGTPTPYAYQAGQNIAKTAGTIGQSITDSGTAMNNVQRSVGNAVAGTLDTFGRGLSGAPVTPAPPPKPIVAPVTRPATALAPKTSVRFAGVDREPQGLARNPAQPQGQPAPAIAAPPQLRPGDTNTFTGTDGRTVAVPGMGSSTSQTTSSTSFQPATPQVARPSYEDPNGRGVASTYGQSVLAMPDDNDVPGIARPTLTLNPRGNGDSFRASEDRAAREKVMSDIGSQVFALGLSAGRGGKDGRAAKQAIGELLGQKAQLASGAEQLSTGAVQGQAQRDNATGIAASQLRSEERRAQLGADVTREGNALGYQAGMAKINADSIQRPELVQDGAGRYLQVGGEIARPVLDAEGNVVRGQVKTDTTGQITPALQFKALNDQLTELMAAPPQGLQEQAGYKAQVDALRLDIQNVMAGAPAGMTVVGSSGGKPVFKDKDGKMHIGK